VLLAGAFLGPRNGALSQILYLAAGAIGAPVFADGAFGIAKLIGPTGGYLLSFPIAALVVGYVTRRQRHLPWTFVSMAAGLLIIFTCGTIQLYTVYFHNWTAAINGGFLVFSWWDLIKLCAAAMTYHEAAKRWRELP
jgi:biotin transport system substrate-specific component